MHSVYIYYNGIYGTGCFTKCKLCRINVGWGQYKLVPKATLQTYRKQDIDHRFVFLNILFLFKEAIPISCKFGGSTQWTNKEDNFFLNFRFKRWMELCLRKKNSFCNRMQEKTSGIILHGNKAELSTVITF